MLETTMIVSSAMLIKNEIYLQVTNIRKQVHNQYVGLIQNNVC